MERWLNMYPLTLIISISLVIPGVLFSQEEPLYVEREMIVKFKSSVERGEEDILKIAADHIRFQKFADTLQTQFHVKIIEKYPWASLYHVRISEHDDFEKQMAKIRKIPAVEFVEPNYVLSLGSSVDALDYKAAVEGEGISRLDIAKQLGECEDVVVAVIDTGVDDAHADLSAHIWQNPNEIPNNGIDDDQNGFIDDTKGWDFVNSDNNPYDDHYHGTHVSGIVLSVQDSPIIKIMPLKFLDANGFGSTGNAIGAIDYAIKKGAKILNNSWGGGRYSLALRDAIISTYYANRIFVAAAGNNSANIDNTPSYPPSYLVPNIISVAALDASNNLAWFSNWGPKTVHVGAPGVSVRSSVPKEKCSNPPCYSYLSGTSMATPYVSGIAALMVCKNPELMHLQVKDIVMETSVSNASLDGKIGKGSVSENEALLMAASTNPDTGDIPPFTPSSIPNSIGLAAQKRGPATTAMGCGVVKQVALDSSISTSGFGGGSGVSLFLMAWPFLFVLLLRFPRTGLLLNRRRKFLFNPF